MTPTDAKELKARVIALLDDPETHRKSEVFAQAQRRAMARDMDREFTI